MAPLHRFVDRDAFARFAGIGIGCQHFQATRVLDIRVGPDCAVDTSNPQPGGDLEVEESGSDTEDGQGLN